MDRSKWSRMASFPFDVTMINLSRPESRASSIPYCRIGLSTSGSISLGMTFVAGKKRVPKPAQGKTHVRSGFMAAENIARITPLVLPHRHPRQRERQHQQAPLGHRGDGRGVVVRDRAEALVVGDCGVGRVGEVDEERFVCLQR